MFRHRPSTIQYTEQNSSVEVEGNIDQKISKDNLPSTGVHATVPTYRFTFNEQKINAMMAEAGSLAAFLVCTNFHSGTCMPEKILVVGGSVFVWRDLFRVSERRPASHTCSSSSLCLTWPGSKNERNMWSRVIRRPCMYHTQVNHQGSGRWVSIPPVDGALTINVGDM